jgi:hypothetical protein
MSTGPRHNTGNQAPDEFDPKAILSQAFPSTAFVPTPEDVLDVLTWSGVHLPLSSIEDGDPLLAKAWAIVIDPANARRIEKAALMADDLGDQTVYVLNEIQSLVRHLVAKPEEPAQASVDTALDAPGEILPPDWKPKLTYLAGISFGVRFKAENEEAAEAFLQDLDLHEGYLTDTFDVPEGPDAVPGQPGTYKARVSYDVKFTTDENPNDWLADMDTPDEYAEGSFEVESGPDFAGYEEARHALEDSGFKLGNLKVGDLHVVGSVSSEEGSLIRFVGDDRSPEEHLAGKRVIAEATRTLQAYGFEVIQCIDDDLAIRVTKR